VDPLVDSARRALTLGQDAKLLEAWRWVVLVPALGMTGQAESSQAEEFQLLVERVTGIVPGACVEV
jgi:hypothetical protein